jgi:hypothetical protein
MPNAIAVSLKLVADFYSSDSTDTEEMAQIRDLICQTFIFAYREARRENLQIAEAFLYSFVQDFPGVSESLLLPKWCSLAQASLAFKELAHSNNRLLVWQQACRLFQSYSEFLNGLLPYLIILRKISQKKSFELSVFSSSYANKINQFEAITGEDDGFFTYFIEFSSQKSEMLLLMRQFGLIPTRGKLDILMEAIKKLNMKSI